MRDARERVVGEVNSVSACREVKMKGEEIRVRELRVPIASRRDHLEVVLDVEAEEVLRRKVERKEARVVSRSSEVLKYLKDIVCRMKTTNEARGPAMVYEEQTDTPHADLLERWWTVP